MNERILRTAVGAALTLTATPTGCSEEGERPGATSAGISGITLGTESGQTSHDPDSASGSTDGSSGGFGPGGATEGATEDSGAGPKFDLGDDPDGGNSPPIDCDESLSGTARDFPASHPDFEYVIAIDPGIVEPMLGGDKKPVYAGNPDTPTTHGKTEFDQWYRDVGGVNMPIPLGIDLVEDASGQYVYDSGSFFPIDGQGFGNEGNAHNYHFTLELHTEFTYEGGEVFTFRGDDDVFTFINDRLAIDLGGVHGALEATIDLDAQAAELGLVVGQTYPLDFFFAERHTSESNFRIETTISCFTPPG